MAKRYKEKNKKDKEKTKNKIGDFILNLLLIVFIILFVLSLVKITKWYLNNRANAKVKDEILKAVKIEETENGEENYIVDFNILKERNSDTVAWLKLDGTDIEFPVVKTTNNGYYLSRNFDKEYNLGGWIFADCKNKFDGTDKNMVIYGHNMRDNSMFGSLKNILKEEWYNNEENYKIKFITENEKSIYEVFSIYQIEAEDYYIQTSFKNDVEFEKFIDVIKARSIKEFNLDITKEDNILTLSTCANNNKYRIVLHARKIKN